MKAIDFIHLVKQRFVNQPRKFHEFRRIVSSVNLQQEEDDHARLISQLKSLFQTHQDLLFALNQFLPNKYQQEDDEDEDEDEDDPPKKKCKYSWLLPKSPSKLFDKVRDRCIEKNDVEFSVLIQFTQTVLAYNDKKISFYQADQIFKILFRNDPDLFLESNSVLGQELWRKGKKKEEEEEDNSGEDEHSELVSKGEKKNANDDYCMLYKETMDVKEVFMFEMDMVLSRLGSTIQKFEENPDRLEECLTVLDFKCIEKLYNDDSGDDRDAGLGETMVEILKSDPVGRLIARVVVLERLKGKKVQLEEQKLRSDRIWKEIFEDIRQKGRVCRRHHTDFLRRTEASINGYKK